MSLTNLLLFVIAALVSSLFVVFVIYASRYKSRVRWQFAHEIKTLEEAAHHYMDVSAVVTLTEQLTDPEVLEKLKTYPVQVQAAAMLHYIDTLGRTLQDAQTKLSRKYSDNYPKSVIDDCQKTVDELRKKLSAAVEEAQKLGIAAGIRLV